MWKRPSRRWVLFGVLVVFLLFYYVIDDVGKIGYGYKNPLQKAYTLNTTGCKIPHLEVYDETVMKLLAEPNWRYSCSDKRRLVIEHGNGLKVNEDAFEDYKIKEPEAFFCVFQPFWRIDPDGNEDDTKVLYGTKIMFKNFVVINGSFVKVECWYYSYKVFKDYYSFVPKKLWKTVQNPVGKPWNVAIVGVDTLSRLHLQRKMPRTVAALRKIGAIEMFGYNKVEDNTFPNLIPMLARLSWTELQKDCWPTYDTRFDNCSFIFKDFREKGYATFWAEERSDFGLFNYLKKGWWKQPVDYYWNTFEQEARQQVGHTYQLGYPDCLGTRTAHDALLHHTENVIKGGHSTKKPFFSFSWITTLAHNHYDTAILGDASVSQFLIDIQPFLTNTILIFMSDHGYRWGKLTRTPQGILENRLPFMFVKLPRSLIQKHPKYLKNLQINTHRLITSFDLYATFTQLLGKKPKTVENRSISLFEPIPTTRTCDSADIPPLYCTCLEPIPVDLNDPLITQIAQYILNYTNNLLANHSCSFLTLQNITYASLIASGGSSANLELMTKDYSLMIKTAPNGATLSGSVRVTEKNLQLTGNVDRLDWYGNQSYCVSDPILKLYCYCLPT